MLNTEEVTTVLIIFIYLFPYIDLAIIRLFYFRGYFPKGGGEVELQISPVTTLSPINITKFGSLTRIWGRSYVAGVLPIKVCIKYSCDYSLVVLLLTRF